MEISRSERNTRFIVFPPATHNHIKPFSIQCFPISGCWMLHGKGVPSLTLKNSHTWPMSEIARKVISELWCNGGRKESWTAPFCTSFDCGGRERDAALKDHEGEYGCSISITYAGAKPCSRVIFVPLNNVTEAFWARCKLDLTNCTASQYWYSLLPTCHEGLIYKDFVSEQVRSLSRSSLISKNVGSGLNRVMFDSLFLQGITKT